jgi:hypothetical protein
MLSLTLREVLNTQFSIIAVGAGSMSSLDLLNKCASDWSMSFFWVKSCETCGVSLFNALCLVSSLVLLSSWLHSNFYTSKISWRIMGMQFVTQFLVSPSWVLSRVSCHSLEYLPLMIWFQPIIICAWNIWWYPCGKVVGTSGWFVICQCKIELVIKLIRRWSMFLWYCLSSFCFCRCFSPVQDGVWVWAL